MTCHHCSILLTMRNRSGLCGNHLHFKLLWSKPMAQRQLARLSTLYRNYLEADEEHQQSELYTLSNYIFKMTGYSYDEAGVIAYCDAHL